MSPAGTVWFVLPADVEDPALASGGNTYDRRAAKQLAALGWRVHLVPVSGNWPRPSSAAQGRLRRALAALPTGAVVLLDGLVACGAPEVVVPHAERLQLVVLVHMPLADDTALSRAAAAELHTREGDTLRATTAVVTTSAWSARRLVDRHDLAPDRVHAVPPGTDPAPPATGSESGGQLLCVAAVTPHKGHDLLVAALATLGELPWNCVCVGSRRRDSGQVRRIRRLIAEHDLTDRVRLAGTHTGARLDRTYAEADLLVLASRGETYGMVVAEALARGIPVLATEVGALPDTLGRAPDGTVPGLLVPPDDPDALGAALRRWLTEPELREELRAAALCRRPTLPDWTATGLGLAGVLAPLAEPTQSGRPC